MFTSVLMLCKKKKFGINYHKFYKCSYFCNFYVYIVVYKGMLQSAILIFLQKSVFDIVNEKKIMLESSALCSSEE